MNTKKVWGKILELPEATRAALFVAAIIFATTVISIIVVEALISRCLDSQYPRRWRRWNGICEEYHDGEWGEPSKDSIYRYNEAGSRTTE